MLKSLSLNIVVYFLLTLSQVIGSEEFGNFQLDRDILYIPTTVGDSVSKEVGVKNTGTTTLEFSVDDRELKDFIMAEKNFKVEAKSEKILILNFSSNLSGVFTGKISIKTGAVAKAIPIIFEVETKNPYYDATVTVLQKFRKATPYQGVIAKVTLFNNTQPDNVSIFYYIKDMHNKAVYVHDEILYVENRFDYLKEFKLPIYLKEYGYYVLVTEVKYKDKYGIGSSLFEVIPEKKQEQLASFILSFFSIFGIDLDRMDILNIAFVLVGEGKYKNP